MRTPGDRGGVLDEAGPAAGDLSVLEAALAAGGETGRLMRSMDWSGTPLGPMSEWPPLLRAMVATCVLSPFPMDLSWGPDLIYIYNDAAGTMLGQKHPDALGRPKREALPELWDLIAPVHREVMERGQATWREN